MSFEMGRGHWMDPLARQILKATGHLPKDKTKSTNKSSIDQKFIELELKALEEKQRTASLKQNLFIDVNRASLNDWLKLPGCTREMADLLLRLQRAGVQLSAADDLFKLLELPRETAEKWDPYLIFRWYGDAPPLPKNKFIDLNSDSHLSLRRSLNWPEDRLQRLIKERQRETFKDLADLQERLMLPASTIEELIGNVRFGSKAPGPKLPPRG